MYKDEQRCGMQNVICAIILLLFKQHDCIHDDGVFDTLDYCMKKMKTT